MLDITGTRILGYREGRVNKHKIQWIREMRLLTGAELLPAKLMYDLLWELGYDLNLDISLIFAAKLYREWNKYMTLVPERYELQDLLRVAHGRVTGTTQVTTSVLEEMLEYPALGYLMLAMISGKYEFPKR